MAPRKRPAAAKTQKKLELWQEVGADMLVTALFIVVSASFGELSVLLADMTGLDGTVAVLMVLLTGLVVFDPFRVRLGGPGASFNPSNNIAQAFVGKGTLLSHALRMVAQAVGGALGAFVALSIYPTSWASNFAKLGLGVRPQVSVAEGILCEMGLGFVMNFIILWSGYIESSSQTLAMILPLVATAVLIFVGAEYTGPSMNPAFTFSWFWHMGGHDSYEHAAVFWAAPLIGGAVAGLLWAWAMGPTVPSNEKSGATSSDTLSASKTSAAPPQAKLKQKVSAKKAS